MNDLTDAIRKQIEGCRELLKIFQSERQMYVDQSRIEISDVNRILCRKKQLVEIFDQQHHLILELKSREAEQQPVDAKEQMRELGSILEQLLVIDHENEKLLRHCLTTRTPESVAAPAREAASSSRPRPALQRQLPFVPGARPAAPVPAPAPVPVPAARTQPAPAPRNEVKNDTEANRVAGGKHLLRQYTTTANLFSLTSKYA